MADGLVLACASCGQKNRVRRAHLGERATCGRCKGVVLEPGGVAAVDRFDDLQTALATAEVPVLVDFWAPWCAPCRAVAPELTKVASRHPSDLVVLKVNTDTDPAVGSHFGIRSIPTMALFVGGRERARSSGARSASEIESWMRSAGRAG